MFYLPHGLTVDHEDNVWVTDVGAHQVQYDGKFALSYPGSLLGAGQPSKRFGTRLI